MTLTQKETTLLKDLTDQEKLCIDKYTQSSDKASDPQLKNLFTELANAERNHLNTLNQISGGNVPTGQGGSQSPLENMTFTAKYGTNDEPGKKEDCFLCTDLLTTEKHASHLYDTCIFEFSDKNARDCLNAIQKQEQLHGKVIYDYMSTNNMY